MINFHIILVIIALAAWLGNVLLSVEATVAASRTRVKGAKDSIGKIEATLSKLQREEEKLSREIDEITEGMIESRRKQAEVQQRLAEAQAQRRPRLLILSDRRNNGDKEWLVTVVNTQIREVDANHPLAADWAVGRDYLVWAESDRDAAERAQRRFNARPGYSIKSVAPVRPEEIYPASRAPASAASS
jgi:cell division protein FtsB